MEDPAGGLADLAQYADIMRKGSYEDAFSYDMINKVKTFNFKEYASDNDTHANVFPKTAFITVGKRKLTQQEKVKTGWKFHVSLDDEDEANIAVGWNLIKNILIKHNVAIFKVIKSGIKLSLEGDGHQRGKQITIYQCRNPEKNWEAIIQEITEVLAKNKIKPSYAPPSDHPVPGSSYVYYRNDAGPGKQYVKATNVPGEKNEEFEKFRVNVALQPIVKMWQSLPKVAIGSVFQLHN